jgi:hypothetical protein
MQQRKKRELARAAKARAKEREVPCQGLECRRRIWAGEQERVEKAPPTSKRCTKCTRIEGGMNMACALEEKLRRKDVDPRKTAGKIITAVKTKNNKERLMVTLAKVCCAAMGDATKWADPMNTNCPTDKCEAFRGGEH